MQEIIFLLYYNMIHFSSAKTGQLVSEIFMFESVSFYKEVFVLRSEVNKIQQILGWYAPGVCFAELMKICSLTTCKQG